MTAPFFFEAEVLLIRWGESSSAGRTITLELPPDAGDGHPFKGFPTGHAHGQRFRIQFAAIGDDEQPINPSRRDAPSPSAAERPGVDRDSGTCQTARARASQFAKERYQEAPPMVQARTRASLLAKDERFQAWSLQQSRPEDFGLVFNTVEGAADFIREHCCDGNSRNLIATNPEAYRKFLALETMFKIAVGEIAEPR